MKILSFDIESCTGSPNDGSLCSFGYVLADENFNIIEKKDVIVNPKPKYFRLGKWGEDPKLKLAYEESVFRAAPIFPKVYKQIKRLFNDDVMCVGFAICNDVRYLNSACKAYGLPVIDYKFCDVQMLLGFFDADNSGLGLGKMGEKYDIQFTEHKSDDDAYVTLLLLKKMCEGLELDFSRLLDYYEIVPGKNSAEGIVPTYSLAQLYNRKGLKRSKAQSGILLHEFLDEMRERKKSIGPFRGKRICFNADLEKNDINYSRSLISKIYDLGGHYTSDLTVANVYVSMDDVEKDNRIKKVNFEKSSGRRIRVINESKFISELGEVEPLEFDDVSILVRHSREKQENRLKMLKAKQNYRRSQ